MTDTDPTVLFDAINAEVEAERPTEEEGALAYRAMEALTAWFETHDADDHPAAFVFHPDEVTGRMLAEPLWGCEVRASASVAVGSVEVVGE